MFKELNPILHSQLRLAIMSILLTVEEAEFVYLKEKTQSTAGNLSVQLDKLSEAGYIEVEKSFVSFGVVVHALNKVIGELCLLAFFFYLCTPKQVKRCMMP